MAALSDRSGDRCVSRGRWPRPPGCEQQVKGQGRIVAGWCAVLAVQPVLLWYPLLTGWRARLVELHQRARVGDLLRKSGTRAGGWDECAPSAAGHERALVLGFLPFPAGIPPLPKRPGGAKRTVSNGQGTAHHGTPRGHGAAHMAGCIVHRTVHRTRHRTVHGTVYLTRQSTRHHTVRHMVHSAS